MFGHFTTLYKEMVILSPFCHVREKILLEMTRHSMHEWFCETKCDELPNAMKGNVNVDVDVVSTWFN